VRARLPAYLGSWELCLHEVAEILGRNSAAAFRDSLPHTRNRIETAAFALRAAGLKDYVFDWESLFDKSRRRRQHDLTRQLQEVALASVLDSLPVARQVDVRSAGGTGAGSFLEPHLPSVTFRMPDSHLRTSLRARLGLSRPGFDSSLHAPLPATHCNHRAKDTGALCGQAFGPDASDHDPLRCDKGGAPVHWHNRLRDYLASWLEAVTGSPTDIEQIVRAWCHADTTQDEFLAACDLPCAPGTNVQAARKKVARLDIGAFLGVDRTWIDVGFTCPRTADAEECSQRANSDGRAAAQYVSTKRRRYPVDANPLEPLVPFIIEAFGRPAPEAVAFLRTVAPSDPVLRAQLLPAAWQNISMITQMRLAELYISAEHARPLK